MTSKVPDRTKVSTVSRACSAASGCTNRRSRVLTPMPSANCRSSACSASTKRQKPEVTTSQVEGNRCKMSPFNADEAIGTLTTPTSFYTSSEP